MWKRFSLNGNFMWHNQLDELVEFYNNRKHRTTKMKPNDVSKDDEQRLLSTVFNYKKTLVKSTKFQLNDHVRISKQKNMYFEKGYTTNWSTEIFKIYKINRVIIEVYYLQDYKGEKIQGLFYAQELLKTENPNTYLIEKVIFRKGNRAFCKFLGFSEEHNGWVDANTLV